MQSLGAGVTTLTHVFLVFAEEEWESLWRSDDYENEYFYVSQLFAHNWQPRIMT